MSRKIIPFWLMPGSWGLSGQSRKVAEAEYYFDGEELERKLIDISEMDEKDKKLALLEIDLKNNKITQKNYDFKSVELTYDKDTTERELAIVELKYKYNSISRTEYEKETHTLKDEPWVGVINDEFNVDNGINGFSFELDWNDQFIEFLKNNGYSGERDEHIVEQWFDEVSQDQLAQMLSEQELEPTDYSIPKTNTTKTVEDGKTHYS